MVSRANRAYVLTMNHSNGTDAVGQQSAHRTEVNATKGRRAAPLSTPTGLQADATLELTDALSALLADQFALYIKTKNFHWHCRGRTSATTTCCSTSRPSRFLPRPTASRSGCASRQFTRPSVGESYCVASPTCTSTATISPSCNRCSASGRRARTTTLAS